MVGPLRVEDGEFGENLFLKDTVCTRDKKSIKNIEKNLRDLNVN